MFVPPSSGRALRYLLKKLYVFCNIAKKTYSKDIVYTIYQLFHTYCTDLTMYSTALQAGRSLVRLRLVLLELFIELILPAAPCALGRLSL